MSNESKKEITSLPKWAQEYIQDLIRQRQETIKAMNTCLDHQTKAPVWTTNMVCTGEEPGPSIKTYYIHSNAVHFRVGKEVYEVTRRDDCLEVRCQGRMVMRMHSSNSCNFIPEE